MNLEIIDPIIHPNLDRYAKSQFTFVRSKDNIPISRRGYVDMLKWIDPTHYLTFNFYDHYSMDRAEAKMNKWYADIHYRLLGAHPNKLPENRLMPMVGHPEYTEGEKHIHYHVAARISSDRQDWFLRAAPKRWKAIVKTGNLHIRVFDGTEAGLEKATIYSTKSSSHVEWYIPSGYRGADFDTSSLGRDTRH